ncbi:alkaline phosphatase family protein [Paeniglutamicibacter sp. ABSL32-1]|uniref:alkaline phosphatase D family protein n=1 Tax=Paeniglutamicibacter quisquiliarum TaxID=2849498 RepID=UPI001C2DB861|nr:alkaline phosphatase D family protein [Paeniglutamicibacter quisquiliarum]MBV1781231.1 alkaline phosphatase family protein [Paeniglutamicibacter quisquiliarum]
MSTGTTGQEPSRGLLLGPLLRHVDETNASIWVETAMACTVEVRCGADAWRAATFGAHGHHYALVEVSGLEPGSVCPYTVHLDGVPVWPLKDGFPDSMIATLDPGRAPRLAFGSCRTSIPHDEAGNRTHGIDAMRAYALSMAAPGHGRWPDAVLFLGDQVYADSTSLEMQEFIRRRRDIKEEPGAELKDFEEYAHLYRLAWSDPANRWLLSTLPSAMIFDDHDIRDDWNSSISSKRKIEQTTWWHERLVSGLGSYWIYQHLGNLSPGQRAEDPLWRLVADHTGPGELDLGPELVAFAERVDTEPESHRWSYCRDWGGVRLVVLDSRAARRLDPEQRAMLDPGELAWLDERMRGGFNHLLIGTSLPFLLPMGLHHVESWDEAISSSGRGRPGAWLGERLRRKLDLEHWAAFQRSFQEVARIVTEVADGKRGPAPQTVTFLSGDVHFSYVSEIERGHGSRILQAVCSPIRNPLPRFLRYFAAALAFGPAVPFGAWMARRTHVPSPPFEWDLIKGPWFDNNLAILEDTGDGLAVNWFTGVARDGDPAHPGLKTVAVASLAARRDEPHREDSPEPA